VQAQIEIKIVRGLGPSSRTTTRTVTLEEHELKAVSDVLRAAESDARDAFHRSGPRNLADALEG
jgi:hypothetical protein